MAQWKELQLGELLNPQQQNNIRLACVQEGQQSQLCHNDW